MVSDSYLENDIRLKCAKEHIGIIHQGDYFPSLFMADAPKPTYDFSGSGWKPDAFVIDLGTNDMRVIKTANSSMADKFTKDTVAFMHNVTAVGALASSLVVP